MKRKFHHLLLLLFVTAVVSGRLEAQNPWKKVTITVTDAVTNKPVESAEVMFKTLFIKTRKQTNSEGKAVFDMLLTTESLNMNYTVTCPPGVKTYKVYTGTISLVRSKDVFEFSAPVQSNSRMISFRISDDKRQPMSDATVTLNDDNGHEAKARTDAGGNANFDIQPDTQFKNAMITVAKEGFKNYSVPVEINNQTSQVSVVAPLATNTIVVGSEPTKPIEKPELPGPTRNVTISSMPPGYSPTPIPVPLWGPYTPACDANPLASVPVYTSLAVEDEKTLLDKINSSCIGAAGEAVDALVDLTENIGNVSTKLSAVWDQAFQVRDAKQLEQVAQNIDKLTNSTKKIVTEDYEKTKKSVDDAVEKTQKLYEKMKSLAAGPEMYAINCIWDGFKDYAVPEPLLKLKSSTAAFGKAQTAMQEKMEAIKKRVESGTPLAYSDKELFTNWKEVTENVDKTTSGLNLVYSYISDPIKILPYETQVNLAISTAETMIGKLMTDCQIREVDRQIRQGIAAGQSLLSAARKRAAQMKKGESKWREIINDFVFKNFTPENRGWEHFQPNDVRLLMLPQNEYNTFVKYHNEGIDAEKEAIRLEEPLKKLGALCAKIQPMAAILNERVNKYEALYTKGLIALDACKLEDAREYAKQLQTLENSECGHFFPKPFGKTKSEELSAKIFDSKKSGKCVEIVPLGAYVLTKTELTNSNDWLKIDEKSLQSFSSDDKNNKFPCASFTLLTPIPSTLVPGKSIKIDISGSCLHEKTFFTFHPYLYLKGENMGNSFSFDSGNSKTSVGRDPIDKHFVASATGTMELNIPKDGDNKIVICLRINWSEEGSTYYWADYYFEKK